MLATLDEKESILLINLLHICLFLSVVCSNTKFIRK